METVCANCGNTLLVKPNVFVAYGKAFCSAHCGTMYSYLDSAMTQQDLLNEIGTFKAAEGNSDALLRMAIESLHKNVHAKWCKASTKVPIEDTGLVSTCIMCNRPLHTCTSYWKYDGKLFHTSGCGIFHIYWQGITNFQNNNGITATDKEARNIYENAVRRWEESAKEIEVDK